MATMVLGRSAARLGAVRDAATGALLGAVWGVVARLWMRLISENPEFSWSGTIFIVMVPTIIGLFMALARRARRTGWRSIPRRIVTFAAGVVVVPLGTGAGVLMLPSVVLGGFALRGLPESALKRAPLAVLPLFVAGVGFGADIPGYVGVVAAVVLLVCVLGIITRFAARPILAMLACAPAGFVLFTAVAADIPLWQRLVGAASYLPLVGIMTMAFARYVLGYEFRKMQGTQTSGSSL